MSPRSAGGRLAPVAETSFNRRCWEGRTANNWDSCCGSDRPLLGPCELFPPGSTFKTVVAAAALEAGVAGPDTLFDDPSEFQLPGSTATISNFGGGLCGNGSQVDLMRAFVRSCNTVFADLAIQVGAPDIGFMAEALGFNRDLDFPLPVAESVFPTAELENDDAALGQSGLGAQRAGTVAMAVIAAARDEVLAASTLVDRCST